MVTPSFVNPAGLNGHIPCFLTKALLTSLSSFSCALSQQHAEEKAREQGEMSEKMTSGMSKAPKSKADKLRASQDDDFKPVTGSVLYDVIVNF